MTLSYKRLQDDQRIILNAPNISLMMCGLARDGTGISQTRNGDIILRYESGAEEWAHCPDVELAEMELFPAVRLVQDRARAK